MNIKFRNLCIIIFLLFTMGYLLVGCGKKEEISEDFKNVIYEDNLEELSSEHSIENLYPVVNVSVIKTIQSENMYKVFVQVFEAVYSFDNGIFNEGFAAAFPLRYDFDKNLNIINKHYLDDGEGFKSSILKMTEGDEDLTKKIMQSSFNEEYDNIMSELKRVALEKGLKNFTYKIEDIPGYKEDVKYINKAEEKVIYVIRNKDYEDLQKEREKIVAPDVAGTHWVYKDCIKYHEKTGICVEGILDFSD